MTSIRDQARGEILADFVWLAKEALDDGQKDGAAVLGCAALEDTLERFAESDGLDVADKGLTEVINALKTNGSLVGPQAKVVQACVGVRNKALHAEWEKINISEVHAVLAFVQDLVARRFA